MRKKEKKEPDFGGKEKGKKRQAGHVWVSIEKKKKKLGDIEGGKKRRRDSLGRTTILNCISILLSWYRESGGRGGGGRKKKKKALTRRGRGEGRINAIHEVCHRFS